MHQKFSYLQPIKIIILALLIAVGTSYLSADWTAPNSTPPTCLAGDPGCDAPLNVGYFSQVKQGNLNIRGISDATHAYVNGLIVENGFVGIGTTAPSQKLDVAGNINVAAGSAYKYNGKNVIIADTLHYNYFFGGAGNSTMSGWGNMASGLFALANNTEGNENTANGYYALFYNTTGNENTANGASALMLNKTGSGNVATGFGTLNMNTTGSSNTANGFLALRYNTTGSGNTADGAFALKDLDIKTNDSTGYNTAIGYNTGVGIVTGSNNTIVGANVTGLAANLSNNIIIADGAGNRRINVDKNGNVGIGTTAPSTKLQVTYNPGGTSNRNILTDILTIDNVGYNPYMGFGSGLKFTGTDYSGTNNRNYGAIYGIMETAYSQTPPDSSFTAGLAFYTAESNSAFTEKVRIKANGNVGIGTASPQGKLDVNGSIFQRGSSLYADYVFEPSYQLESIADHASFMWNEKHLKAVPKGVKDETGQDIVDVGAQNKGMLEELEKAHVYIQQLDSRINILEAKVIGMTAPTTH